MGVVALTVREEPARTAVVAVIVTGPLVALIQVAVPVPVPEILVFTGSEVVHVTPSPKDD